MRSLQRPWLSFIFLLFTGSAQRAFGESVYPGPNWEYGSNGLVPGTVRELDAFVRTLDTAGLMVVKNGRVIYEYGDVQRLSYLASARKSVLSMLYGPYVASGSIRLEATLKELGMSDIGGLLPIEERAKVIDLITARSGVYHPAGYDGDMLSIAPKRGSKKPGDYWLYSNWDFNAAGAAFEQMTGKNIYDSLRDDLAIPIGMQDFDRRRQQKSGDLTQSQYPAYPLVLSTRDMARLGLLMLRQGKWRERQIIPAEWVRLSTSVRTPVTEMQPPDARAGPFGYGYMWWVWDGPFATGPFKDAYTAQGAHGQYITILPALDMVVAHKTLSTGDVSEKDYLRFLDLLTGQHPASPAELSMWESLPQVYNSYVGQYRLLRNFTLGVQVMVNLFETHRAGTAAVMAVGLLILFIVILLVPVFRKRGLVLASLIVMLGLSFCLATLAISRLVVPTPSAFGVRRDGNRLQIVISSPPKDDPAEFNLHPTSVTTFLIGTTGVPLNFFHDAQDKVTRLTARLDGKHDFSFEKLSDQPPEPFAPEKERVAIKLDPHIYDAYVGRYTFASDRSLPGNSTVTIKRDEDALIVEITGQYPQEFFPESETNFFNTTEDGRLAFLKNARGEATGLILFENGRRHVGEKLEDH